MIQIIINRQALDIADGFSMAIEETNPIFNDLGSQSLPVTVPYTHRNARILNMPSLMNGDIDPGNANIQCMVTCGSYKRSGYVNIVNASKKEGISFNVGFDNSTAYQKWQQKKLAQLSTLPIDHFSNGAEGMVSNLNALYRTGGGVDSSLTAFPVILHHKEDVVDGRRKVYDEILNEPTRHVYPGGDPYEVYSFEPKTTITRMIDNVETEVTVPKGYGFAPFVKVWKILELIFSDLGLEIVNNVFRVYPDLARLVVLHNVCDGCCRGDVYWSDFMPDVTVESFLKALWVRFGLVYYIDFDDGTVKLDLIDDVLTSDSAIAIDRYLAGVPLVNYDTPKYIRLKASTSIDGAAPATERFEDYIKDFDLTHAVYDGNGGYIQTDDCDLSFYADNYSFSKYDKVNKKTASESTAFFNWDPATPGLDGEDLTSEDECVPVGKYPHYLFGSRHRHTVIKGSDATEDGDTPLAFVFAFTEPGRYTVGAIGPSYAFRNTHRLSLLFQFKNGLFSTFWKKYDEILRHGNRSMELSVRMNAQELREIDMLRPVVFMGVRYLVDSISYSLPSSADTVDATFKLRAIQAFGEYDIDNEQKVPDFDFTNHDLYWDFDHSDLEAVAKSRPNQLRAIKTWLQDNPDVFIPVSPAYYLDVAECVSTEMYGQTWDTDPANVPETCRHTGQTRSRSYKAMATYEIYPVFDPKYDNPDSEDRIQVAPDPVGETTITIDYTAYLVCRSAR